MRTIGVAGVIAAAILAFGLGFVVSRSWGNKPPPIRTIVCSTIKTMEARNHLTVYKYTGDISVSTRNTKWWVLSGQQYLSTTPDAYYYLEIKDLVFSLDGTSKTVLIKIPPLKLSQIDFHPDRDRRINKGLGTMSPTMVDDMLKDNYETARGLFTQLVTDKPILDQAKGQAKKAITEYFEIPLRAIGGGANDYQVRAYFDETEHTPESSPASSPAPSEANVSSKTRIYCESPTKV